MPRNSRWLVALAAGAAALCVGPDTASAAPPAVVNPAPFSTVTVDRNIVPHGESFSVSASRFWPSEEVYVRLVPHGRAESVRGPKGPDEDHDRRTGRRIVTLAILLADADGNVSATLTLPDRPGRDRHLGEYHLELAGHGSQLWQSTPFTVVPRDRDGHPQPHED
ncbi:hypothetical protein ACH4U5_26590 [Streptomyces sp. NPDC020858]|uniref:hypothetical protein n=1 Tax=Streptomyces sp. NPDC020858 TaxID=3365097 RepID=UPI0037878E18